LGSAAQAQFNPQKIPHHRLVTCDEGAGEIVPNSTPSSTMEVHQWQPGLADRHPRQRDHLIGPTLVQIERWADSQSGHDGRLLFAPTHILDGILLMHRPRSRVRFTCWPTPTAYHGNDAIKHLELSPNDFHPLNEWAHCAVTSIRPKRLYSTLASATNTVNHPLALGWTVWLAATAVPPGYPAV
jgi:hypothetical protein